MYENFFLALVGGILLFIYTQEKDTTFKLLWLMSGLATITTSYFADVVVTKTIQDINLNTANSMTTGNTINTYTYQINNLLVNSGVGFGLGVFLVVFLLFIRYVILEVWNRYILKNTR